MGKHEVLESVLGQIKKRYGEGAIMWLGESGHMDMPVDDVTILKVIVRQDNEWPAEQQQGEHDRQPVNYHHVIITMNMNSILRHAH